MYTCYHSIIILFIIGLCLAFSKTSHVDSLDRFRKLVVEKVKLDINNLTKQKHSEKEKIKIKYANEFIQNMELGDPKTCDYQFIFDENDSNNRNIIQYLNMHVLGK